MVEQENWWAEEAMEDVTLDAFEKLVDQCFELQAEIRELDLQRKEKNEVLNVLQEKVIAYLDKYKKKDHSGRKGNITVKVEAYPSVPKDPQKKKQFFWYLKEKGVFDDLITVNSQTLRAFYKEEQEMNKDNPDFNIPGLEPYERVKLHMRRKK